MKLLLIIVLDLILIGVIWDVILNGFNIHALLLTVPVLIFGVMLVLDYVRNNTGIAWHRFKQASFNECEEEDSDEF